MTEIAHNHRAIGRLEMTRFGFGVCTVTVLALLGAAVAAIVLHRPDAQVADTTTNPAANLFPETELDLGRIPMTLSTERRTESFEVLNSMDHDISFLPFVASCGCVAATADPATLRPGQRGRVQVTINTSRPGSHSERVFASTDDPDSAPVELKIRWHAVPPLELAEPVIDFSTVRPGSSTTRTMQLTPSEFCDVRLDDIEISIMSATAVTARITDSLELEVTLNAAEDIGPARTILQISSVSDSFPEQRVAVQWNVQPIIACEPSSQFAGVVTPGQQITKVFVVRSAGPPLQESVTVPDEQQDTALLTRIETLSESVATVRVEMNAPQSEGPFERRFRLPIGGGDCPDVEAAITGIVRGGENAQELRD